MIYYFKFNGKIVYYVLFFLFFQFSINFVRSLISSFIFEFGSDISCKNEAKFSWACLIVIWDHPTTIV